VSVKATGHSYTGSSQSDGSILINMRSYVKYSSSPLGGVTECSSTPTASQDERTPTSACRFAARQGKIAVYRVGGGQLWDEAYGDLSRYNQAKGTRHLVVGGAAGTVGAAGGWLQGGGLSGYTGSRMFGYGVDSVVALEMVLIDGSHVRFGPDGGATEEPVTGQCNSKPAADESQWQWGACSKPFEDLWFAVRGGGGGTYGVVLSVHYFVHRQPGDLYLVNVGASQAIPLTQQTQYFSILSAMSDDTAQLSALHNFLDAIDTLWLDFSLDFLFNPSALGLSSDITTRCGTGDFTLSLHATDTYLSAMFCYSEEAKDAFMQSWLNYTDTKQETITAALNNLQSEGGTTLHQFLTGAHVSWARGFRSSTLSELDLRALAVSVGCTGCNFGYDYYTLGVARGQYLFGNPTPGHVPDQPAPIAIPDNWGRAFTAHVPASWVLNKNASIPVLIQIKNLGSGLNGGYLLGGKLADLDPRLITAMPENARRAAMTLYTNYGAATSVLREALYGAASGYVRPASGEYPGDVDMNHHSAAEFGPVKQDWTQACGKDWPLTQKHKECISIQEAVWGTKNLRRLEAIKRSVDPTNILDCYHCVGLGTSSGSSSSNTGFVVGVILGTLVGVGLLIAAGMYLGKSASGEMTEDRTSINAEMTEEGYGAVSHTK